ncbi:hypothetical protein E4U46_000327 [Claviceps purpurea]|nr:hypothetical protein E4U46_000327 [Claviceps purpurea]
MSLFILAETPAGYCLFKAADKNLFKNEDLAAELGRPEKLVEMLKLKNFVKFDSAAKAHEEATSLQEGNVSELLATLLEDIKSEKKASLAVADMKLGTAISNLPQFNITLVPGSNTMEVFRGIREHLSSLVPGLEQSTIDCMSLGLSHSMYRHKTKFFADKSDPMIVQAVRGLDEMEKNLSRTASRAKEWYGRHFPEMARIVNDDLAYARVMIAVGKRTNMSDTDLSKILPEEVEVAIKAAAEISIGTDIEDDDLENMKLLAEQVITDSECCANLTSYLEDRMRAIAPNLSALIGYLIGAKLIAHAGSLINLTKLPASTIQLLGAGGALFHALENKHDTPKYGWIRHSPLIRQATDRNKGKIARALAAKMVLALRVDAFGDTDETHDSEGEEFGPSARVKLENRLRKLEGKPPLPGSSVLKETKRYNKDALTNSAADGDAATSKKSKKEKKRKHEADAAEAKKEKRQKR